MEERARPGVGHLQVLPGLNIDLRVLGGGIFAVDVGRQVIDAWRERDELLAVRWNCVLGIGDGEGHGLSPVVVHEQTARLAGPTRKDWTRPEARQQDCAAQCGGQRFERFHTVACIAPFLFLVW